MERSIYSNSWYRVAEMRPQLRRHAAIYRQHYRGQLWYVLQDRTSGRFHRYSPAAHFVISLMDGQRTTDQIWQLAAEQLGDDVLTQDEMIRLLHQLHASDVLNADLPPDIDELSNRAAREKRRNRVMRILNPLAIRIPIVDPNEFLEATLPVVRVLFSSFGLLLFLGVVGYAIVLTGMHWSELTEDITARVMATENLLLMIVAYPLIKLVHELGHGYAVKRWGGDVHEIGIMFLVFMPVPYVDASAASAFHSKWARAFVGSAGIMVELFLASLAWFVWLGAEDGIVRAFAFNVMFIGGVSTLLFNGNPLLRFDGYYVLADLVEIPNLGRRSNLYLGYLIQRYLFGLRDATSPVTEPGERAWMVGYAFLSFVYRIVIMVVIVTFVAQQFFVIGVLMAIWSVILMLGLPLFKHMRFLFASPVLRRKRGRALAVSGAFACILFVALLVIPMPYATVTEGVLFVPGEAAVHAGADGVITELLATPNSQVRKGEPLMRMADPLLETRVRLLAARVRELEFRLANKDIVDQVEARIAREQLRHAQADLDLAQQRRSALLLRSKMDGKFILNRAPDQVGRYVHKGELLGFTADLGDPVVRVIVSEDEAELVRHFTRRIDIRYADALDKTLAARIVKELPALSDELPSMALSTIGGGDIALDPTAPDRARALSRLLQLELKPDTPERVKLLGSRVHVRFDHGTEPLGLRMWRTARQVFLKQFNV